MGYLDAAFGPFAPQRDVDAALKLSLSVIFEDNRLDRMVMWLSGEIDGIAGDPGWTVEVSSAGGLRRSTFAGVTVEAEVDVAEYELKHPTFSCDVKTFREYLHTILNVYMPKGDVDIKLVAEIRDIIQRWDQKF
jgi:hypothetical protein